MATNLPLHCTICPKRPSFSDVSHLLTHVASKGHLSHYYKAKVRAAIDKPSKDAVDVYDAWYADWNVQELMSERLQMKESRKARPGVKNIGTLCSKGYEAHGLLLTSTAKATPDNASVLDPRLSFPSLSYDCQSTPILQSRTAVENSYTLIGSNRSRAPVMFLWQTNRPASYRAIPVPFSSPILYQAMLEDPFTLITPPKLPHTPSNDHVDHYAPSIVTSNEEVTKLKGVTWPGMGLFDAATSAMKRKRNQKKDKSVLAHLEHTSMQIEALEAIYNPSGTLKKLRPISGQVDPDSSPISIDRPLPKRRARNRTVLGNLDINSTAFARRNHSQQTHSSKQATAHVGLIDQIPMSPRLFPAHSTPTQTDSFGSLTEMRYLTSGFHYQPGSFSPVTVHTSTSFMYEPDTYGLNVVTLPDMLVPFHGLDARGQFPAFFTTASYDFAESQCETVEPIDDSEIIAACSKE